MKRKLIRRNKQFLSSKLTQSYNGYGRFQQMRRISAYDNDVYKIRYVWRWWYCPDYIEYLFSNTDLDSLEIEGSKNIGVDYSGMAPLLMGEVGRIKEELK